MYNELLKSGLTEEILKALSYKTKLEKSLVNSLRKFDKEKLLEEISYINNFYQENEILDELDMDYRIKSYDSCARKYIKFYPQMRVEKTFNDLLGFRMVSDNYEEILKQQVLTHFRISDMSLGKAKDDGYRGVHMYYQIDHFHYPIEIQINSYYDPQLNNWLHKFLYKKNYGDEIGLQMRWYYENGSILNERQFKEVLQNVLSGSQKV